MNFLLNIFHALWEILRHFRIFLSNFKANLGSWMHLYLFSDWLSMSWVLVITLEHFWHYLEYCWVILSIFDNFWGLWTLWLLVFLKVLFTVNLQQHLKEEDSKALEFWQHLVYILEFKKILMPFWDYSNNFNLFFMDFINFY